MFAALVRNDVWSGLLRRLKTQAAVLVAVAMSAGTSTAQDSVAPPPTLDLERRIAELESIVQQLQADRTQPGQLPTQTGADGDGMGRGAETVNSANLGTSPSASAGRGINLERQRISEDPGASPSQGLPPGQVAGWSNGFYLQSPDQRFVFRITGQIQADYHAYLNPYDHTDIDTFLLRRARFGLEATLYNYYEFRFLPDFGLGKALIEDAYLNIHYWDGFQFEAGKFKQPFSYEQLIQDRYVPTLERSLIDQLVPQRDEGIMVHGDKLLDHHLDYAFSISNGEINGDIDQNNNKDFNARIAVHPFGADYQPPPLRYLEIGMSTSWGEQNQPVQPSTLITPLGVRWFTFIPTVLAYGLRDRYSPELSYFLGPLGLATQYFHMDQDMIASPTGVAARHRVEVTANGYYALATLLLTGERRTGYSQAIDPLRPFNARYPFSRPGAWELVARVSGLRLGSDVFTPGAFQLANPATNAPGATEMTLGFNWYLNRLVRMQFNWEHSWFDSAVQLGPTPANRLHQQDAIGTRFQVIF
jgi:phosphate-selective porin OprO/OprP